MSAIVLILPVVRIDRDGGAAPHRQRRGPATVTPMRADERREARELADFVFKLFKERGTFPPGLSRAGIGYEFRHGRCIVHLTASGAILTVQVSP